MKSIILSLFILFCFLALGSDVFAQHIVPSQINWPNIASGGPPQISCSALNYGMPYLDLLTNPPTHYSCGLNGWQISGADDPVARATANAAQPADPSCGPNGSGTLDCLHVAIGLTVYESDGASNLSPFRYTAVCDGTTDDTTAFQNSSNALTYGGTILVPITGHGCVIGGANGFSIGIPGATIRGLSRGFNVDPNGVNEGTNGAKLVITGDGIYLGNNTTKTGGLTVERLYLWGQTGTPATKAAINVPYQLDQPHLDNLDIAGNFLYGLYVTGITDAMKSSRFNVLGISGYGIYYTSAAIIGYSDFDHCSLSDNLHSGFYQELSTTANNEWLRLTNCEMVRDVQASQTYPANAVIGTNYSTISNLTTLYSGYNISGTLMVANSDGLLIRSNYNTVTNGNYTNNSGYGIHITGNYNTVMGGNYGNNTSGDILVDAGATRNYICAPNATVTDNGTGTLYCPQMMNTGVSSGWQVVNTDNFQRADGGLGSNWTTASSPAVAPAIVSNLATGSASGKNSVAYWTTWAGNDQKACATIGTTTATGDFNGVTVRTTATTGYDFACDSGSCNIQKMFISNLASGTFTVSNGDTLCLQIVGTSLTATQNGTTILTATDGSYATGNPGIFFYNQTNTGISDWNASTYLSSQISTCTSFGLAKLCESPSPPAGSCQTGSIWMVTTGSGSSLYGCKNTAWVALN